MNIFRFSAAWLAPSLLGLCVLGSPATAHAGVPECGGLRLEEAGNCEIRGSVQCEGSCNRLGIYKKACATKLQKVCRQDCKLSAQPTCTDQCTGTCKTRCDRGENITCTHNCFGECKGSCNAACGGKPDVAQCLASCEANCDGECDVKCGPVLDAPCYTHCIECCGGSCGAQANMDCQTTCQDKEFETCEHELEVDCNASCSAKGAIFCGGEFVLAGDQVPACVKALTARGIATADLRASVSVGTSSLPSGSSTSGGKAGCSITGAPGGGSGGGGAAHAAWLMLAGIFAWKRARRSARDHASRG